MGGCVGGGGREGGSRSLCLFLDFVQQFAFDRGMHAGFGYSILA